MDFAFSAEQDALRTTARRYLTDRLPLSRVAELADSDAGWDVASWPELTALGWLDEELGPVDHAVVFEEAGYSLYPGPLFASLALARPAGYRGAEPATLAFADPGRPATLAGTAETTCRAERYGEGWRLTGRKTFVPDLLGAAHAVVLAAAEEGPGCWLVDLRAGGATLRPLSTRDRTRRLGELILSGTPATPVVPAAETARVFADVRRAARAALACEAVGVAQRCLDLALDHARNRQQFGRPIGSYQAIAHRLADVYTSVALARSLAYWASWCVAERDAAADSAAAAAGAAASDAAVLAAEAAVQTFGGAGFTWDSPLHRFYRRAQWIAAFDGGPRNQRAGIAAMLLD